MVLVLPELAEILILFGALLFIYLCVAIVKALFGVAGGTLGKLPVVGGWINSGLHDLEHKIVGVMSNAAAAVDSAIGFSLHELARLIDWMGREIRSHSNLLYTVAALTLGPGFAKAVHSAVVVVHKLIGGVDAKATSALHRLQLAEKRLAHQITAGVIPRLGRLERRYDRVIHRDIARLRDRVKSAEGEYERLWKYVRSHPWTVVTEAFVGAVAIALTRLDLGWLRCPSFLRMGKRIGCGGFGAAEELLFGAATALAAIDICDFAALAYTLGEELSPVLMELVDIEQALVGCHGASAPPPLGIGPLSLPPVSRPLALAA